MMTINSKNDVLNDQELNAVSGGMSWIPASVVPIVTQIAEQTRQMVRQGGQSGQGGQTDPDSMFRQIMQQLSLG